VPLPVLIELPNSPPSGAAAVVEACSAGTDGRECLLVSSVGRADSDVVATVTWRDAERRVAVIRLGLGLGEARVWQTRDIEFKATDDPNERWRSVGLVIAGIAADYAHVIARTEPARPAKTEKEPDTRADQRRKTELWIDASLVAGPSLNEGSWKGGASGRASLTLAPWPLAVTASVAYERQLTGTHDFTLQLPTASLGALVFMEVGPGVVVGRFEVVERLLVLSASDRATGTSETRHRWQTGGRGGLEAGLPIGAGFWLTGGADVTIVGSSTEIQVLNGSVGRLPGVATSVLLGARWALNVR
jgi:hypothetical protein